MNAGDFDPIAAMADLATEHDAWLHVDGAFGLFARIAPTSAHLAAGVGTSPLGLLRRPQAGSTFRTIAASPSCVSHTASSTTFAEGSRLTCRPSTIRARAGASWGPRAPAERALRDWATLRAYGRSGYREMVERHLQLAQRLARRVDSELELERLAEVPLNIVCFRWRPEGAAEDELDQLNRQLGDALLRDGRVFAGTTVFEGRVAFRPAIVNWRTRDEDVDALVAILLELARDLRG